MSYVIAEDSPHGRTYLKWTGADFIIADDFAHGRAYLEWSGTSYIRWTGDPNKAELFDDRHAAEGRIAHFSLGNAAAIKVKATDPKP